MEMPKQVLVADVIAYHNSLSARPSAPVAVAAPDDVLLNLQRIKKDCDRIMAEADRDWVVFIKTMKAFATGTALTILVIVARIFL